MCCACVSVVKGTCVEYGEQAVKRRRKKKQKHTLALIRCMLEHLTIYRFTFKAFASISKKKIDFDV